MICKHCGKEIENGSVFCEFCGGKCESHDTEQKVSTKKIIMSIAVSIIIVMALGIGFLFFYNGYVKPLTIYKQGISYLETGYYEKAKEIFAGISGFKDSRDLICECDYRKAVDLMDAKQYDEAKKLFTSIEDYQNSKDMAYECDYQKAVDLLDECKYDEAKAIWLQISDYNDSAEMVKECIYQKIMSQFAQKELWKTANVDFYFDTLASLGTYKDCDKLILSDKYNGAIHLMSEGKYEDAISWFSDIIDYEDSKTMIQECHTAIVHFYVDENDYTKALSYCSSIGSENVDNLEELTEYVCSATYARAGEYLNSQDWENAKICYSLLAEVQYEDSAEKYDETVNLESAAKKKEEEKKKAAEKAAKEKAEAEKAAKAAAQVPYDNITGTWSRGENVLKISNRKWGYYVSERNYQDFKWAGLTDSLSYKDGVYFLYNSFWGKTYSATISGDELIVTLYSNDDPGRAEMGYAGTYIKTSSSVN